MFLLPIVLIHGFYPHVMSGQAVRKGDILASQASVGQHRINLAQALNLPLRRAAGSLRKNSGEQVFVGDVLAQKPGMLGLTGERIISQVSGTVAGYERETGELIIHTTPMPTQQQELISPLDGVISICDNEKIVIQTESPVIVAREGSGHMGVGTLHVLSPLPSQEINYYDIDATATGKVILGGQITRDTLVKALGMNVMGVITANMTQEDLSYIQQKYSLPVLIVHEQDYHGLTKHHGRQVYVDGLSKSIVV